MRKYTIAIILLAVIVSANVKVYANNSKVVDALQKLPYLYNSAYNFFIIDGVFSVVTFKFSKILIDFILGIIILSIGKNLVCQGAVAISNNPKKTLFYGLTAFMLLAIILILFLSSLVGFPFGILIIILEYIITLIGKVSLNIYIGNIIENKFKQKWYVYLDYLVGAVIIETICLIPYIGNLFIVFIIPIISVGIVIISLLNKFIYKIYYKVPFNLQISEKKYIREDIKKIILDGIKKDGENYEKKS